MERDESGDWTEDSHLENGEYFCICCNCKRHFIGHKRRIICKACWTNPKQPQATQEAAETPGE